MALTRADLPRLTYRALTENRAPQRFEIGETVIVGGDLGGGAEPKTGVIVPAPADSRSVLGSFVPVEIDGKRSMVEPALLSKAPKPEILDCVRALAITDDDFAGDGPMFIARLDNGGVVFTETAFLRLAESLGFLDPPRARPPGLIERSMAKWFSPAAEEVAHSSPGGEAA
ncbi:MAG: hypothetical protein MI755_16555 [Sphingomonadales bacterium]|nr:hypothetical protein [Sphingomonadales bacterium]